MTLKHNPSAWTHPKARVWLERNGLAGPIRTTDSMLEPETASRIDFGLMWQGDLKPVGKAFNEAREAVKSGDRAGALQALDKLEEAMAAAADPKEDEVQTTPAKAPTHVADARRSLKAFGAAPPAPAEINRRNAEFHAARSTDSATTASTATDPNQDRLERMAEASNRFMRR